MKVIAAARLVAVGQLAVATLWTIATDPERVQIALLLGKPGEIPAPLRTPARAWAALNVQQRQIVLDHAPPEVLAALPTDPADPTPAPNPP